MASRGVEKKASAPPHAAAPPSATAPAWRTCDHKFVDSKSCQKCGWTPAAPAVVTKAETKPPAAVAAPTPTDLLRLDDVARQYRISERTVRRWIHERRIPYVMVGPFRIKCVPRAALETHVDAKPKETP